MAHIMAIQMRLRCVACQQTFATCDAGDGVALQKMIERAEEQGWTEDAYGVRTCPMCREFLKNGANASIARKLGEFAVANERLTALARITKAHEMELRARVKAAVETYSGGTVDGLAKAVLEALFGECD